MPSSFLLILLPLMIFWSHWLPQNGWWGRKAPHSLLEFWDQSFIRKTDTWILFFNKTRNNNTFYWVLIMGNSLCCNDHNEPTELMLTVYLIYEETEALRHEVTCPGYLLCVFPLRYMFGPEGLSVMRWAVWKRRMYQLVSPGFVGGNLRPKAPKSYRCHWIPHGQRFEV